MITSRNMRWLTLLLTVSVGSLKANYAKQVENGLNTARMLASLQDEPIRSMGFYCVDKAQEYDRLKTAAFGRIDTPQMVFVRTNIDKISDEVLCCLAPGQNKQGTDKRVAWFKELKPIAVRWITQTDFIKMKTLHDMLHAKTTQTELAALVAWAKKGRWSDPRLPLLSAGAEYVANQSEEIIGDLYKIVVQHAPSVTLTQEDVSFDKQAAVAQLNDDFDKIDASFLELQGKKPDEAYFVPAKNVLTAFVALVKDEALLADIQKRIDAKKAKDIIDALEQISKSDAQPASVIRMREALKEFNRLSKVHKA